MTKKFIAGLALLIMWGSGCERLATGSRTGVLIPEPTADVGPHCRDRESTLTQPVRPVDLLFVVDSSGSMVEEQENLRHALPELVRRLVTGDHDLDGVVDFTPVSDLRFAVITPDLGYHGPGGLGCVGFGDDGRILEPPATAAGGCESTPRILSFRQGEDPLSFAEASGCLTTQGTQGCGFEQPLEALLKAVSPSSSGLRFGGTGRAHGDGANHAFFRPDAVLGVVVVTDEDDCSLADPLDPLPSLECNLSADADADGRIFPTQRFANGLLEGRHPERVSVTVIAGVPPRFSGSSEADQLNAILRSEEMTARLTPACREPAGAPRTGCPRIQPSCVAPGVGHAIPPRRLVETARELRERGATVSLESICTPDLSAALEGVARNVGATIDACVH